MRHALLQGHILREPAPEMGTLYERFDRKEVLKLLEELKAEMKEKLGDKLAGLLLFGSYSRGDYSASSDVDLLILSDGVSARRRRMR